MKRDPFPRITEYRLGVGRPTLALYALLAALGIATLVFARWSWRSAERFRHQLSMAARTQAEVLARDFSEAFRARFDNQQAFIFEPYLAPGVAWTASAPERIVARADSQNDQLVPVLGAFFWSSRDSTRISATRMSAKRADALRRRATLATRSINRAVSYPFVMKVDADGNETFALTYLRKLSDDDIQIIGVLSDAGEVAARMMSPLMEEVARYRLGDRALDVAEWRIISPGGTTLAAFGSVQRDAPTVVVPFWRSQLLPDSAAGYRLLLAPLVIDSVLRGAPTNPATTPFLLSIRADPARVAEILYGSSISAAVPVGVLLGVSLTLIAATLLLARRFDRHARDRDAFASSVAHELRTPLTQILLYAETLQLDRPAAQTRQDASRVIVRETRRLIHIVENALQFVRGGRSAMRLDPQLTSLADVLNETLDGLAPVLEAAVASVERRFDADAVALVDANALRQIVVNLVDNAARFGPPGQTIVARVWSRDGHVSLSIEDEGPGIAVPDRERVFGPFVTASTNSGSGIGLAVVRQLVELHDGSVFIEGAPTGGARIVVRFPAPDASTNAIRQATGNRQA